MSIEIIDITPVVTVLEVPFTIGGGTPITAPTNVTAPSIGADDPPRVDDTLGAWPGVWDQVVSAFTYQWYRDGGAISGATSQTYDLVLADEGAEITVGVAASNSEGSSAEVVSAAVGPVEQAIDPIAPIAITAPSFDDGVYQVGESTPFTAGTYGGSGTITVTRTLEFLSAGLWSEFPGLPSGAGFVGSTISWGGLSTIPEAFRIKEVASNGTSPNVTQYSDTTVVVYAAGALPVNVTPPDTLITGVEVGDTVSTTGGEDDGQGAPITGYEYRYLRDGTPISGATSLTYTLVSADLGTTITPQRRAVTSVGTAAAWTSADAIAIPGAAGTGPILLADETVLAVDDVGSTLDGSIIYHGDGSISVPIAAGAAQAADEGVFIFVELPRSSEGDAWPENIAPTRAFGPFGSQLDEHSSGSIPVGLRALSGFASNLSARTLTRAALDSYRAGGLQSSSSEFYESVVLVDTSPSLTASAFNFGDRVMGHIGSAGLGVNPSDATQTKQGRSGHMIYDEVETRANGFTNALAEIAGYITGVIHVQRIATTATTQTARFIPSVRCTLLNMRQS